MNSILIKGLKRAKCVYEKLKPESSVFGFNYDNATITQQQASDLIKTKLLGDGPTMICRLGSVELSCVLNYFSIQRHASAFSKCFAYVTGKSEAFWWDKEIVSMMGNNAGFFPTSNQFLERFSQLMLHDMAQVDVLGSWLKQEKIVNSYLQNAIKIRLPDLEPYYHQNPWTEALAGKTILVVHPYDETICNQYHRRKLLFLDGRILPDFELKTIRAVQSIGNNQTAFRTWFDAYEHMCRQISHTEFDIAIIGCGAYGFPLAAHVKRIGKKAVHLGGATQIMFGITGKRWEDHSFISKLINENWVRPSHREVPANYRKIENGAYW